MTLAMLIALKYHRDKILAMPGKGIYIKEKDKVLLDWPLEVVSRFKDKVTPSLLVEIAHI